MHADGLFVTDHISDEMTKIQRSTRSSITRMAGGHWVSCPDYFRNCCQITNRNEKWWMGLAPTDLGQWHAPHTDEPNDMKLCFIGKTELVFAPGLTLCHTRRCVVVLAGSTLSGGCISWRIISPHWTNHSVGELDATRLRCWHPRRIV